MGVRASCSGSLVEAAVIVTMAVSGTKTEQTAVPANEVKKKFISASLR